MKKDKIIKNKVNTKAHTQADTNRNAGITLITLAVTILIIIILASITINAVLGDNGLLSQAQDAKDLAESTTLETGDKMNSLLQEYMNVMAEDSGGGIEEPGVDITPPTVEDSKGEKFDNTTQVEDASGDTVWIPGGFEIAEDSANDADDGIVITDGTNEFVWIPVGDDDLAEMYNTTAGNTKLTGVTTTTSIYSKLRVRSGDSYTPGAPNTINIREPDVLSKYDTDSQYYQRILGYGSTKAMADAMVAEYKATYDSIVKYDGFYIGRYELTGTVSKPTVKKGQTVLSSQNWYKLKQACTNVVNTDYAQTTMIYGNQWDEVMDWLVDTGEKTDSEVNTNSASWGNYNDSTGNAATGAGTIRPAGYSEYWKANNIYDLAGNCREFTQEAYYTDSRVIRGGICYGSGSRYPASDRSDYDPISSNSSDSSRPALYIK